jgi:hypothetical protein
LGQPRYLLAARRKSTGRRGVYAGNLYVSRGALSHRHFQRMVQAAARRSLDANQLVDRGPGVHGGHTGAPVFSGRFPRQRDPALRRLDPTPAACSAAAAAPRWCGRAAGGFGGVTEPSPSGCVTGRRGGAGDLRQQRCRKGYSRPAAVCSWGATVCEPKPLARRGSCAEQSPIAPGRETSSAAPADAFGSRARTGRR